MIKKLKRKKAFILFFVLTAWVLYTCYYTTVFYYCGPTRIVSSAFCNCKMIYKSMGYCDTNWETETVQSQCSDKASAFGRNQNVVSYSLFVPKGRDRDFLLKDRPLQYSAGVLSNLRAIRKYYKDWKMRVYTESAMVDHSMCKLECSDNDFFLCNVKNIPGAGDVSDKLYGMMWRFLPIGDPTVDVVISRDLDSEPSLREKKAVDEWLISKYAFHAMRDHPFHNSAILGGMFGGKNKLIKSGNFNSDMFRNAMFKANEDKSQFKRGMDQKFLGDDVYPHIKSTSLLVHDSYKCTIYNDSIPFPTQREGNEFVGSNFLFPGVTEECPQKCRPTHGKNWTYC